jgi:hypothetical protein
LKLLIPVFIDRIKSFGNEGVAHLGKIPVVADAELLALDIRVGIAARRGAGAR